MRLALERGAAGVLLLNNDTRVAPDFLRPLLDAMNSMPWAGAVSSAILRMDRPDMLDVAYSEVRFWQRNVVQIRGVNALVGQGFDARREVEVAIGCSLLLRAEALRTVGLFDEAYFAYHEEVDWCIRAHAYGWKVLYAPTSAPGTSCASSASTRPRPRSGPSRRRASARSPSRSSRSSRAARAT
jgi:GT2 family glycosyltransferase